MSNYTKAELFSKVIILDKLLEKIVPLSEVLEEITRCGIEIATVKQAQEGDFILYSQFSSRGGDTQRQIVLGKAFDEELNNLLKCCSAGDKKRFDTTEGENIITVLSVKRSLRPQASDLQVEKLGIKGVNTIDDYCRYYLEKNGERFRRELIRRYTQPVLAQIKKHVAVGVDENAVREFYNQQRAEILSYLKNDEKKLYEILKSNFSNQKESTDKQLDEAFYEKCKDRLVEIAIGKAIAEADGKALTEKTYDEYIEQAAQLSGKTIEEVKSATTFEAYELTFYAEYVNQCVAEYLFPKIKLTIDKNTKGE